MQVQKYTWEGKNISNCSAISQYLKNKDRQK